MDARVDNLRKQAKPMVVTNSSVNSLVSRQNKFIQDELSVKLGLVEGKRQESVRKLHDERMCSLLSPSLVLSTDDHQAIFLVCARA